MKKTVFSICATAILLIPVAASAETYAYDWSYTAGGGTTVASGTLVADNLGGLLTAGKFQIDSFSGTLTQGGGPAQAVTLVQAWCAGSVGCVDSGLGIGATVPGVQFDNLLYDPSTGAPPSHVDYSGIDFITADGTNYNIYAAPPNTQYQVVGNKFQTLDAPFSVTATPEPASIVLIGGGLAALGLVRRRNRPVSF